MRKRERECGREGRGREDKDKQRATSTRVTKKGG